MDLLTAAISLATKIFDQTCNLYLLVGCMVKNHFIFSGIGAHMASATLGRH